MDRPHVTYRFSGELPHDADAAFAWLTDYSDADPSLTTAIVKERRVVKRGPDTVEMEGAIAPLGRFMRGPAVVKLYPEERRWVADVAGGRMVNEYRLTPTARGCRLDVVYRVPVRRWTRRLALRLAKRRVERELALMWAGFFEAMGREVPPPASRAGIPL